MPCNNNNRRIIMYFPKHRVLIQEEEVTKRRNRQSVGLFVLPDDDAIIRCLDNSDKYEPITSRIYLNMRFYKKF